MTMCINLYIAMFKQQRMIDNYDVSDDKHGN